MTDTNCSLVAAYNCKQRCAALHGTRVIISLKNTAHEPALRCIGELFGVAGFSPKVITISIHKGRTSRIVFSMAARMQSITHIYLQIYYDLPLETDPTSYISVSATHVVLEPVMLSSANCDAAVVHITEYLRLRDARLERLLIRTPGVSAISSWKAPFVTSLTQAAIDCCDTRLWLDSTSLYPNMAAYALSPPVAVDEEMGTEFWNTGRQLFIPDV